MPVNDSSQKGQAGGGSQDPEPVRELLRLLVKTSKAMRLYQEGSTVPTRLQADLFSRLSSYLEKAGALALDISEFELRLGEESVYESNDPKNSLAFLLFRDGIYRISLNPGLQEKELQGLLSWFNRVAWVRVLALRQQLVKLTLKGRQALFELFMDFNRAAHAGAHPSLEKRSFTMYSSSSFLPILAFLLCSFVVSISFKRHASDEPAPTDPRLQDLIEKVAKRAGFSTLRMPSGAGHDAQSLGYFGIPIGVP